MARPRILALTLVACGAFAVLPARAIPIGSLIDSFTVSAGDIDGTTSTAVLQAGGLYQITAEGSFTYKSGRLSDAECTSPPADPLGFGPFGWTRYGHFFYALNHPDLVATLPWDPDPTDDATDLYVDNRNIEWVPAVPLGFPPPAAVTPLGCSPFHSYEAYFVPVETRQVNVRVFDTWYDDNLNSDPFHSNGPQISIYQIAAPPLPSLVHLQTVLVHTRDPAGSASTALGAGNYLLLAHGEYKYGTSAGPDSFADAECSNGNPLGVGDGALWLRERYPASALELLVANADTLWIPLVPVPAEVPPFGGPGFCDPVLHYYYQVLSWPGGALPFKIQDTSYGDNLGTLSVEIFKLL